jgi:hypothetical protein
MKGNLRFHSGSSVHSITEQLEARPFATEDASSYWTAVDSKPH